MIFFSFIILITYNHMKNYWFLIVVVLIGFNLIINYAFRQSLYSLGIDLIISFQTNQNTLFILFFNLITSIVDPIFVTLLLVIFLFFHTYKFNAFTIVLFFLINVFFITLTKTVYADPRPYWTSSQVKSLSIYCPGQYGNPSGHSWLTAIIVFTAIDFGICRKSSNYLWVICSLLILVPISRMYLGAHSLNQVVQGLFLGLSMLMLYKNGLKDQLQLVMQQGLKNYYTKICIIILHLSYFIAYLYIWKTQKMPSQWITNISNNCGRKDEVNHNLGQHLIFSLLLALSMISFLISSLIIGISECFGNQLGRLYLEGKWSINEHQNQYKRGYVKFILIQLFCLISGIVVLPILYISNTKFSIFVVVNLSVCICGYIFSAKTYKILYRFKVIYQVKQPSQKELQN